MPPVKEVSPHEFEKLLFWLDENRELAAIKYEKIRSRLIKIFVCRGSLDAESLADATIDRVAIKIEQVAEEFVGNSPELYFYGVARYIYHESLRRDQKLQSALDANNITSQIKPQTEHEAENNCLNDCLRKLAPSDGKLFLHYYENGETAKSARRQSIADSFRIDLNLLRVKIYRIKQTLKICVTDCVKNS